MKKQIGACLLIAFVFTTWAQETKHTIFMDLAHGQRMWNDPKDPVQNIGFEESQRVQYMNDELSKTLKPHKGKVSFLKKEISYNDIAKGSLLILHVPSSEYSKKEVMDIKKYINQSGSLLLIMEADYWTDLEKTNVNDIIKDYGIQYGAQNKDTLAGGYARKEGIVPKKLKVTYELGRSIEGGEPFAFNSRTNEAFAVYKELDEGGRLVVLGDAMASLYMTEWRGISDYQCQEFMDAIFKWLLRE
ncbi:MAG: hypothetical protein AAGF96_03240 [Bacteroidota bacterium]